MSACAAIDPTNQAGEATAGDRACDSGDLRQWLNTRGTAAGIPNKSNRKLAFSFNKRAYRLRHRIENAFCRLKDFRRIATRYDKRADTFLSAILLAAAITWWT